MLIQTVDFAIASNLEVDVHRLDFGNYTVSLGMGRQTDELYVIYTHIYNRYPV